MWADGHHGLNYHLFVPPTTSRALPLVLHFHGGTWTNFDRLSLHELNITTPFFSMQQTDPHFALRPVAKRRQSWVSPHIGPLTGSHLLPRRPPTSLGLAMGALDAVLSTSSSRASSSSDSARARNQPAANQLGLTQLTSRPPNLVPDSPEASSSSHVPSSPTPLPSLTTSLSSADQQPDSTWTLLHSPLPRIDTSQLLVSGASMGGYATWELILRRPSLFEAAVPICGGGDPSRAHLLSRTRIWAFHARDDDRVPINASREMFEAILRARRIPPHRVRRALVGEAGAACEAEEYTVTPRPGEEWPFLRLTEYVRGGHNAWIRALSDPRLYVWWRRGRNVRGMYW